MAVTKTTTAAAALFLAVNLLFSLTVSATCNTGCPSYKPPKPSPSGGSTPGGSGSGSKGKCPIDTLKLGVCANVLNGLINVVVGKPPKTPCCPLIQGLADVEAAACLCTAIKANILGINLNVPVSLSLLLNYCGKKVPTGFQCP